MFQFVRFFLLTSAAVAAAIAVAFVLHRQSEVERLIAHAERQNVELARAFANTIWPRFSTYVASASRSEQDQRRADPELQAIGRAVEAVAAGPPAVQVKNHELGGPTVFFSENAEVG